MCIRDRPALKRLRLPPRDRGQRRAVVGPHHPIGFGGPTWTEWQDEAAKDRLPEQRRQIDDIAVGEEFGEITPDGCWLRRVRSAQIDQQDSGLVGQRAYWALSATRSILPVPSLGSGWAEKMKRAGTLNAATAFSRNCRSASSVNSP